jgi:hypothetical protein
MRIWSLHPKHLDAKGLVALWRETLLAKHVLEGKTKGYINHPQLNRFKKLEKPLEAINRYLEIVFSEALSRGYSFDHKKFKPGFRVRKLRVTSGQFNYEIEHLQLKLKKRDLSKYRMNKRSGHFDAHPLFKIVAGEIETWKITKDKKK